MKKNILFALTIGLLILLNSCASSMTPMQVSNTLPELTKAEFMSQTEAEKAVNANECKYLVKGRSYNAPIGLTVKYDLKNAAKGIDEWVDLDGGNSYVLTQYRWVTVDDDGSTQLYVEFDTMLKEVAKH